MNLVGNTQLVSGDKNSVPAVLSILQEEGFDTVGNPDIYVHEYQSFGVEEARALRSRASLKAITDRRVFIVVASAITNEAQNALLKTLEEPPGDALFFFVVPSPQTLLSTLRSRSQILELAASTVTAVDVKRFLAADANKRLELLKPLLEKGDEDPSTGLGAGPSTKLGAGKRDIGAIIEFLAALERTIKNRESLPAQAGLRAVYRARKYIADKGALVKPLLEQVALLVPQV